MVKWTHGSEAPDRKGRHGMTQVDRVAVDVLEFVMDSGGWYEAEAGTVLSSIAEATGNPYKAVSVAVLYLERMGFVEVGRASHPQPERANRIESIQVV